MDVKGAFDYVSRLNVAEWIRQLGVDNNLINQIQLFAIDRKVEIIIDRHKNPEKEVETGTPQGSPVSLVLCFINISGVFDAVMEVSPEITSVSFIDDLGFFASGNLIQEVATSLETAKKTFLRWRLSNAVINNIAKTEANLFSKACSVKAKEEMTISKHKFSG